MASKNWQAGGKILTSALAGACLLAALSGTARPYGRLRAPSYIGSADPHVILEVLIGGIVVLSFLGAVTLWVMSRCARSSARNCGAMHSSVRLTISARALS